MYSEILYLMTQKEFSPSEALEHWKRIVEHRQSVAQTLGRDIGFQTAVCDYFTNIHPVMRDVVFVEAQNLVQKERSALLDHLTGLYNKRFVTRALKKEMETARRLDQPFSLLMFHVDHFEEYIGLNGQESANRALAEVGQILSQTARTMDHSIRFGPDEFLVILPRCSKDHALQAAERHRRNIQTYKFSGQEKTTRGLLTVTVGVATFPTDTEKEGELVELAEEAAYDGLVAGGNQVVSWQWEKRTSVPANQSA
ncbi:MAG: GGDEF domain-containing protein [Proteobacteria bacterium]|nr:GGDEF domain-containing protein [Pseudomonadota bacterium]